MTDEEHHIGACPLRPLPLGYVTQFGLDYMHMACLGVMRRLIMQLGFLFSVGFLPRCFIPCLSFAGILDLSR